MAKKLPTSPPPVEASCPAGGFCSPVDDVDGQYCQKCLAPITVVAKHSSVTTKDDAQIILTIKKLVSLLDARAKKLGCLNGRKHRQCMDAMDHLLACWDDWKKFS